MQSVLFKMMEYFGGDVRRIGHALKVDGFARAIAEAEGLSQSNMRILHFACVLHDIGIPEAIKKHGSSAGPYQEKEGSPIARNILDSLRTEPDVTERVCFLVGHHHSYHKIDGPDFQILAEADFLVNIEEGEYKKEAAASIREKIFKTASGIRLLETLYF